MALFIHWFKKNKFIVSLLFLSFFLYSIWAIIVPFNAAPDEFQRYDVANFIFRYHELPIPGDERLIYGDYGYTYATNPYLPYIFGAGLMFLFNDLFDIGNLYLVHRIISILSGVISVYLVYRICTELNLEKKLVYFTSAIFAFIPGYSFINAYVNQDSFSIAVNLSIIYLWVLGRKKGWSSKYYIFIGIGLSFCLLTYLNGYIIIPVTAILLLVDFFVMSKKGFIKKLFFLVIPILVLSGWWFVRSYILYNGDFIGFNYSKELSERLAIPELKPSNRLTMEKQGIGIFEMLFTYNWLGITYKSFWGIFGYMDKPYSDKVYTVISVVQIAAFIGLISLFVNSIRGKLLNFKEIMKYLHNKAVYIAILSLIPLAFGLSIYYSYFSDFQAQGRYVYPALFPIVLFSCIGFSKFISPKLSGITYLVVGTLMLGLNIFALMKIIVPSYYQL
ncbi:glycosyltransferase family 39 protein [Paenibacillus sp. NPDC056933]|uniref:glycosyltransferase family 39 protein n=1 Tax=Paenibacillus sp. NPDC056933 TaxID=3345968 RepID=UPI00363D0F66